jgi:hypothetical protein
MSGYSKCFSSKKKNALNEIGSTSRKTAPTSSVVPRAAIT